MKKINMTVGRFQPFTKGHLKMVNDGNAECIVYQIIPAGIPESLSSFKIKGRKVTKKNIENVLRKLNGEDITLTDFENEVIKRPFTNELVSKELDIVKSSNKNIKDVIYVKMIFDAFTDFAKFINQHSDEYEPQYLLCGDDRKDNYDDILKSIREKDNEDIHIIGTMKTYTGSGRTEGVSGTAVRNSIINKDRSAFERIMPDGTGVLFDDFVEAFDSYKSKLMNIIKESFITLKEYIIESIHK